MTLLLHSGGSSSSNSYISQTVRSFDSNRRIQLQVHHHYSQYSLSSSSIWKLTNVNGNGSAWNCQAISSVGMLAAAVVLSTPPPSEETMSNIPLELSGKSCDPMDKECVEENTKKRIQRPKSRSAESCTTKCVGTCIRGGDEGPLNVRRPIIVFKQGFRSRQYCLVECSDICNLLDDADKRR